MKTDKTYNSKCSNSSIDIVFFKTITTTINDFSMIKSGDVVLVTVSGGSDSISLVLSLLALKDKYGIKIGIAHLNHMLRGEESLRDEAFVEKFAKKLALPFYCRQIDVKGHAKKHGLSIEEAGRELRYDFFQHLADQHGYTKIATGHNKEDNAELVLINLLRGAGPKGLSGIPPIRDEIYIRPMIRISKKEILEFLKSRTQEFMFDSSNDDMAYLRNRIRCKLLPFLQSEFNPEIIDALDRVSNILKIEEDYFKNETQKAFKFCLLKTDTSSVAFSKKNLSDLHPAILNRVLRKAIKKIKKNLNSISLGHINDIVHFIFTSFSGSSLDLPDRIRVYKDSDTVIFKKENKPLREIGKKNKQKRENNIFFDLS